jgi:hypothetical protein
MAFAFFYSSLLGKGNGKGTAPTAAVCETAQPGLACEAGSPSRVIQSMTTERGEQTLQVTSPSVIDQPSRPFSTTESAGDRGEGRFVVGNAGASARTP